METTRWGIRRRRKGLTTAIPAGSLFLAAMSHMAIYQNYMDFTNDIGMHLFTYGQRDRMRTLFAPGGVRNPLLSSKVPVALADSSDGMGQPAVGITTFPNPAMSGVTVNLADPSSIGGLLEVYDQMGRQVSTLRITSTQLQMDVSSWSAGMYYIRVILGGKAVAGKLIKI